MRMLALVVVGVLLSAQSPDPEPELDQDAKLAKQYEESVRLNNEAREKERAAEEKYRAERSELQALDARRTKVPVGAEPPQPRLVEGRPVMGMAFFEDRVGAVISYSDGEWRDPNDMAAIETTALLSDPRAKPITTSVGWFQPIKASYRGKEGWQKLRWGMTQAEVTAALGSVTKVKPSEGLQLAWAWKLGASPVVVEAIFVKGRLGGVMVRAPGNSFDTMKALVVAKYGEPEEEEFLSARWNTAESTIALRLLSLAPAVLYMSKAFAVLGVEQIQKMQKKQADEGL